MLMTYLTSRVMWTKFLTAKWPALDRERICYNSVDFKAGWPHGRASNFEVQSLLKLTYHNLHSRILKIWSNYIICYTYCIVTINQTSKVMETDIRSHKEWWFTRICFLYNQLSHDVSYFSCHETKINRCVVLDEVILVKMIYVRVILELMYR